MIRKNEGITLIALVVTIIILLILAGVTLSLISGENGILKRATNAVEVDNIERAKEEVSLEIAKYQAQYYEEKYVNGQIEDNLKVGEWIYNLCKEQQIKIENYIFTITLPITGEISEENPYRVTIKKNNKLSSEVTGTLSVEGKLNWDNFDGNIENEGNINQSNANYMILNGGTYLDTGIQEEQLIQNNEEFTIATSVYINKNMQSKIKNMSILGNHYDVNGITWQFEQNSENLLFVVKKSSLLSSPAASPSTPTPSGWKKCSESPPWCEYLSCQVRWRHNPDPGSCCPESRTPALRELPPLWALCHTSPHTLPSSYPAAGILFETAIRDNRPSPPQCLLPALSLPEAFRSGHVLHSPHCFARKIPPEASLLHTSESPGSGKSPPARAYLRSWPGRRLEHPRENLPPWQYPLR